MKLKIIAEISDNRREVGIIETLSGSGERFTYSDEWIEQENAKPISLSLPLKERVFEARRIQPYFEGLLPEEDARKAIANELHISSKSYLKLLRALGDELIGAIMIIDIEDEDYEASVPSYNRIMPVRFFKKIRQKGYTGTTGVLATSRLSIAGAQAKVGLYRAPEGNDWYEPRGTAPSTHILKPSNPGFENMAVNECLCLSIARKCGLDVPDAFLIDTAEPILAIERYDRVFSDNASTADDLPMPSRLHQEDFCQALGILSEDKYEGGAKRYISDIAELIRAWSIDPIADLGKLWDVLTFDYFIGNCDNHIKNISLLRSRDWSTLQLAPCYDLVNTTIYENLAREMGITIGENRNIDTITRDDFEQLAVKMGISKKTALSRLDAMREKFTEAVTPAAEEMAESGHVEASEISRRILADAKRRLNATKKTD